MNVSAGTMSFHMTKKGFFANITLFSVRIKFKDISVTKSSDQLNYLLVSKFDFM